MTENTLCLNYKDQLFRKIGAIDSGYYTRNFARNVPSFLLSM